MVIRYSSLVIFLSIFNISCTAPNNVVGRPMGNPKMVDALANELAAERQRLADEKIQRLRQRQQAMPK